MGHGDQGCVEVDVFAPCRHDTCAIGTCACSSMPARDVSDVVLWGCCIVIVARRERAVLTRGVEACSGHLLAPGKLLRARTTFVKGGRLTASFASQIEHQHLEHTLPSASSWPPRYPQCH